MGSCGVLWCVGPRSTISPSLQSPALKGHPLSRLSTLARYGGATAAAQDRLGPGHSTNLVGRAGGAWDKPIGAIGRAPKLGSSAPSPAIQNEIAKMAPTQHLCPQRKSLELAASLAAALGLASGSPSLLVQVLFKLLFLFWMSG